MAIAITIPIGKQLKLTALDLKLEQTASQTDTHNYLAQSSLWLWILQNLPAECCFVGALNLSHRIASYRIVSYRQTLLSRFINFVPSFPIAQLPAIARLPALRSRGSSHFLAIQLLLRCRALVSTSRRRRRRRISPSLWVCRSLDSEPESCSLLPALSAWSNGHAKSPCKTLGAFS